MQIDVPIYSDGIIKGKQTKFAGLNMGEGAGDGEICAMRNLTGDHYPLLATREKRRILGSLEKPNGLYAWNKLCWVDGTSFYYDGTVKGSVTDGRKSFAAINDLIIILPDKKVYDTVADSFGCLEAEIGADGESIVFQDGTIYGESALANTVYSSVITWSDYFREGDAVEIAGSSIPANNQTLIIRELDGHEMRFYENSFTTGTDSGTSIKFKRSVPDLEFAFENENRLWGCVGNTIYASKLGDPYNFNVYDGLDTDSFAVDTGSRGEFTGGISYLGYPTFFKEDKVYKVYGSRPSNYELMNSATLGLAAGSGDSLAVAGETLFYLHRSGVCAFNGGIPSPVSRAFGTRRYKNAHGGSDGLRYYISMQDEEDMWHLFVYDTQRSQWHEEDETEAVGFAEMKGVLYALEAGGALLALRGGKELPDAEEEEDFDWSAEFTDFVDDSPNKKDVRKFQIRLKLEKGASCTLWVQMDSTGQWIRPEDGTIREEGKRTCWLAIVPRRADHYRLKLTGRGGCKVYAIARDYSQGSEFRSQPGRN